MLSGDTILVLEPALGKSSDFAPIFSSIINKAGTHRGRRAVGSLEDGLKYRCPGPALKNLNL